MPVQTSYNNGDFTWVDLVAHDMSSARKFYGDLFGWDCEDSDTQGGPPYALFKSEGHVVGGMGQMSDEMKSQNMPPMWNSYVQVADAAATAARAAELGGAIVVPAMQVMEYGSMAFISDPTGGHVGLWQPGTHTGAQVTQDPGSFCWNELATRDLDGAREFYSQLFGWEFAEHTGGVPANYHIIKNQGADNGGMMAMTEEWGDAPPHWMVYFSVADVNASADRVAELGGTVCVPPFDAPPAGRISVVSDSQGTTFSLIQLSKSE